MKTLPPALALFLFVSAAVCFDPEASAGPSAKHPVVSDRTRSAISGEPAWSAGTLAAIKVAEGKPLVVRIFVPLCSNDQIDCGSSLAGKAGDLEHNLYWGAVFGARHFFDRKKSGWTRVSVDKEVKGELERVVYRRYASGERWGRTAPVEELAVISAVHGDKIDEAVGSFWSFASMGGSVSFDDGDVTRTETALVAGYAGHDRLMDGLELPKKPEKETGKALPSFVFACYSDKYFGPSLRRVGATPLVTTKALMAPEAYVIDAALVALGDNEPRSVVRSRVVAAYAKWQQLEPPAASSMFE